jgi:hypothetical protein
MCYILCDHIHLKVVLSSFCEKSCLLIFEIFLIEIKKERKKERKRKVSKQALINYMVRAFSLDLSYGS